jgi:magnesium chelatase subunit I
VFKDRVDPSFTTSIVEQFEGGGVAHTGGEMSSDQLAGLVDQFPALAAPVRQLAGDDRSPAAVAAAAEFVLEGLHLAKRLNKDESGARATYRSKR